MTEKLIASVAQKAIIECQDKILVVRNAHDKKWQLPGGRLHVDELPLEGLRREVLEETGLHVTNVMPFTTGTFESPKQGKHFLVVYRCSVETADVVLQDSELSDAEWVDASDWSQYDYWPVYRDVLQKYFSS